MYMKEQIMKNDDYKNLHYFKQNVMNNKGHVKTGKRDKFYWI